MQYFRKQVAFNRVELIVLSTIAGNQFLLQQGIKHIAVYF